LGFYFFNAFIELWCFFQSAEKNDVSLGRSKNRAQIAHWIIPNLTGKFRVLSNTGDDSVIIYIIQNGIFRFERIFFNNILHFLFIMFLVCFVVFFPGSIGIFIIIKEENFNSSIGRSGKFFFLSFIALSNFLSGDFYGIRNQFLKGTTQHISPFCLEIIFIFSKIFFIAICFSFQIHKTLSKFLIYKHIYAPALIYKELFLRRKFIKNLQHLPHRKL